MPTSSGIEQEIRQRAERRRQELIDAINEGILGQNNKILPDKADLQKGMCRPVLWSEMKRMSVGGKENDSPVRTVSDLLYPARPARSVYNSPLIKTNRSPLWKSPPPFESFWNQHSRNSKDLFGNKDETSWFETAPAKSPCCNTPAAPLFPDFDKSSLSTFKDQRLSPSVPTSDSNFLKSPREEKDLKEHSNRSTAVASRRSGQHSFVQSDKNCWENANLSEQTFIIPDNPSKENDDYLSNDNSTNDIEDTYDMDRFLEEALGSAIYLNLTRTEDSTEDLFHSIESFRTPNKIRPTSTVRSSFHLKKPTVQVEPQNSKVSHLLREAETHQQVMAQASKALTICRSSKAFCNSASLVDAERLLLLASLRHKAVLDDIKGHVHTSESAADFKGQLLVEEVSVPLKEDGLKWAKCDNDRDLWFLCVLSCGQQVLASDAVAYKPGAQSINFTGKMELQNLPSSFVASLKIYALRTYRPRHFTQKSNIRKACSLLRRRSKSCFDLSGSTEQLVHLRTPAFALSGSVSIELPGVSRSQPQILQLEKVPLMSPLRGSASVRIGTSLTSSVQRSGFLTILEKVGESHAWQRRWCHLTDLRMHFWNYPADQDEKIPLDVIDLRCCSSDKVDVAPRYLCPRSRTLMLETTRMSTAYDMNSTLMECNTDFTIIRYFLSCDSAEDMNEWASMMNQIVSSIKAWNIRICNYHK